MTKTTKSARQSLTYSRSSEAQAKAMKATREQHLKETAQDYLEAIFDLIEQTGEARVVDLANRLGISHATVIQTIRRLQRDGFVTSEPYRSIFLTDAGRAIAEDARHRHAVTVALLRKLGVSAEIAEVDAEGMEHHVSKETLQAFENFVGKLEA
ncbi:manganese-binding transcriptional regulator MntR [Coraliomargarita algicola]|uniref:Transcriptional regulator MntR n=1 Tax=Coraliomargarita algicola TaxID=3092156 RepID=A0ABZ0RSF9_9BACT|nr:manganese-binding transcriptional regulator MntR [Coraliomargarita sp. J2-16]WPJ97915.1 manganese-binding transcriptional regulator MntR [Coraliomargarita sp. J2-16]